MKEEEDKNATEKTQQEKQNNVLQTIEVGKCNITENGYQPDHEQFQSIQDTNFVRNYLENIDKKIEFYLDKLESVRIKDEQDNKVKFKRLLEGISEHLNVNFNKSVELAIKSEIRNINQQSKIFIENCISGIDKKYNESYAKLQETTFEISKSNQVKPEADEYLQNFNRILVNNLVPVIESCFEEIRLQVLDSYKNLQIKPMDETKKLTISIQDELDSFLKSDKINEAAILAMDCDDETFLRFIVIINSTHIDSFDASVLSKLLSKAIQYCKDHENVTQNLLDCIEAMSEGFDLYSMDLAEVKELYDYFTDLEAMVMDKESLRMIIKFQKRRCETRLNRKTLK